MGQVPIFGNIEYLNCGDYEAVLVIDSYVPDRYVWICAPVYMFNDLEGSRPLSSYWSEKLKVISNPKNAEFGQLVVDLHNQIVTSPLAEAMSEKEEIS